MTENTSFAFKISNGCPSYSPSAPVLHPPSALSSPPHARPLSFFDPPSPPLFIHPPSSLLHSHSLSCPFLPSLFILLGLLFHSYYDTYFTPPPPFPPVFSSLHLSPPPSIIPHCPPFFHFSSRSALHFLLLKGIVIDRNSNLEDEYDTIPLPISVNALKLSG